MAIQRQIKINKNGNSVTFDPPVLNAHTGDQIFWTNNDNEAHWPGLSDDEKFFIPNQIAPKNPSSIFTPGRAQELDYVCSIHPGETGRIVVTLSDP